MLIKRLTILILVGLCAGGLIFLLNYRNLNKKEEVQEDSNTAVTITPANVSVTPYEENRSSFGLDVSAVKAGNEVRISTLNTSIPGFVIVKEESEETPGEVIGVSGYVENKFSEGLQIKLSREVNTGEKLIIMYYSDNGDKVFNEKNDLPVRENLSTPVFREIIVS